jgi:ABC-type multidrug transport system ATPase subunit
MVMNETKIISLLQIFDKIALLYEGRQIYFGPVDRAKEYFTTMGYHCPDRQTTADFLTSLTNPTERVVQAGFDTRVPRTPDEFAQAWKASTLRAELIKDITRFEQDYQLGGPSMKEFHESRQAEKSPLMYVPEIWNAGSSYYIQ